MTAVTIITEDNMISVDGEDLTSNYTFPSNLWAINWDGVVGEAEWTDGPNTFITLEVIQPYIDAWQAVKAAKPLPVEPTDQENLNTESQYYLKKTDWYVVRKFETGTAIPQEILIKRQEAREAIV